MRTLYVALVLLSAQIAVSEVIEGTVSAKDGFAYIGKFAFDSDPAKDPKDPAGIARVSVDLRGSNYELENNKWADVSHFGVLFFSDEEHSWQRAYESSASCIEKVKMAKNSVRRRFCFQDNKPTTSDCNLSDPAKNNGKGEIVQIPIVQAFDRFWYMVIASCAEGDPTGPESIKNVKFRIHAVQAQRGDWETEFGKNIMGLNTMYLIYFFIYTIFASTWVYGVRNLWRTGSLHPIVRLLTACVLITYVVTFFETIHYGVYHQNGYGVPALHVLAELLKIVTQLTFMLLLLLLGRGWTITTDVIEGRQPLMVGMAVLVVVFFSLFIWGMTGVDPANHVYLYDSVPGWMIVAAYLVAGTWFAVSVFNSYMRTATDPLKQVFFLKLGIAFTAWFALLPFVVIVAIDRDPPQREKTVDGVDFTFTTLAFMIMAYLLWPTRAEKYFHIAPEANTGALASTSPYEELG